MSAIGYYCNVEKVKGKEGEDRVVIIMNGKFLPHVEQVSKPLTHSVEEGLMFLKISFHPVNNCKLQKIAISSVRIEIQQS